MENATKALMIAAGVLMGMMILSLFVYLYYSLGTYITSNQEKMDSDELNKFNVQFINYINTDETGNIEFDLTIHDVVTAANIAYENNRKYNLTSATETYDESTLYVEVKADIKENDGTEKTAKSLEKDINITSADILKNNLDKKYKCTISDVVFSNVTSRVCKITFEKIP